MPQGTSQGRSLDSAPEASPALAAAPASILPIDTAAAPLGAGLPCGTEPCVTCDECAGTGTVRSVGPLHEECPSCEGSGLLCSWCRGAVIGDSRVADGQCRRCMSAIEERAMFATHADMDAHDAALVAACDIGEADGKRDGAELAACMPQVRFKRLTIASEFWENYRDLYLAAYNVAAAICREQWSIARLGAL